ncbi:TIR domain-containing protein [Halobacillus salinarum]|uniref:TIR domain-containing protein n=1 Tax=Halobacillus salinarum TaxID=2932257 RepID=A0ABY4EHN1_9BACI|nr:SEFIR domain-containing protein [Halobacillus salinarum]UOQ43573.1 TIR domain-containing protein [Halobacillus salinarum]
MRKHPKVFISYSQDSKAHADKVLQFSNRLRMEGIDTILDQYEAFPKEGWTRWMDRNITDSDFCLLICTELYYKRVMGIEEEGRGLGVRWEGHLIYQHLYQSGTKSAKFIPVVFEEKDLEYIPAPIRSYSHYVLTSEEEYDQLYWLLRSQPQTVKPELGRLRPLPEKQRKSLFIAGFIDIELWNKAIWKGTAFTHNTVMKEPPGLALLFENEAAAIDIFSGWQDRLGDFDRHNELRISIIEGNIPREGEGYTVHISANVHHILQHASKNEYEASRDLLMVMTRFNRMKPEKGSNHLNCFKESYRKFGSYLLLPGIINEQEVTMLHHLAILKKELELRTVSDIQSRNDLDAVVLPQYRDLQS